MKKLLLTLFVAVFSLNGAKAADFVWGPATWNIQDGWVFESFEDYEQGGVVLTYPNPGNFTLTFLNILEVYYDVYVDGAEEPVEAKSGKQNGTAVRLDFDFLEGHSYKVITKEAHLVQANLATYTTDTLSINDTDSYEISFTIKGPELVKTIDVEQRMSLAIIDQNAELTFSEIDVNSITSALGIESISEASVFGLQANGAYVTYEYYGPGYFDGWRDADGDYTHWGGAWNGWAGHNAYPAVYSIKINETCDTISYFFYDYWKDYNPEESDTIGGSGLNSSKRRVQELFSRRFAPETHYQYVIWDWYDEENDTTYQYRRNYRCDEGSDYKASFVVKANNKYVLINATLHFVSIEDYNNPPEPPKKKGDVNGDGNVDISDVVAIINQMAGTAEWPDANVNGDEKVDISDVVAVINIMAGGGSEE